MGSGVKTFYQRCQKLKQLNLEIKDNPRNNVITCSTHPHNTYLQILSEIGIFGFLLIGYFFIYLLLNQKNLIFKNNLLNKNYLCFYFINLSLIISLMPIIPSGNIFNNWISLMIYYPLGFWIYIKNEFFK